MEVVNTYFRSYREIIWEVHTYFSSYRMSPLAVICPLFQFIKVPYVGGISVLPGFKVGDKHLFQFIQHVPVREEQQFRLLQNL